MLTISEEQEGVVLHTNGQPSDVAALKIPSPRNGEQAIQNENKATYVKQSAGPAIKLLVDEA